MVKRRKEQEVEETKEESRLEPLVVRKEGHEGEEAMAMYLDDKPPQSFELSHLPTPPLSPPTKWFPNVMVPPYVPASLDPNTTREIYILRSPEPSRLKAVHLVLSELEEKVRISTHDLVERLKTLECQMFEDGCLLTQLKWRQGELKRCENKLESNKKKSNHRNQPPPGHRYQTCSVTSVTEEKLAETRSNITASIDRIWTLERKVYAANLEINQLKSQITDVLALSP